MILVNYEESEFVNIEIYPVMSVVAFHMNCHSLLQGK